MMNVKERVVLWVDAVSLWLHDYLQRCRRQKLHYPGDVCIDLDPEYPCGKTAQASGRSRRIGQPMRKSQKNNGDDKAVWLSSSLNSTSFGS
ncbi:hypothetical protein ACFQUU_02140 [Herbaspirillum sp. GCM10030257]|uniref:hypothetical protein n=1 Tax=Herbaspirillum sp. GCM10030257 TaxID=3273393 RepID=UPI0036150268